MTDLEHRLRQASQKRTPEDEYLDVPLDIHVKRMLLTGDLDESVRYLARLNQYWQGRKPVIVEKKDLEQWVLELRADAINWGVFKNHEDAAKEKVLEIQNPTNRGTPPDLKGLITSLPRSGTSYMSRVLRLLGAPEVGHEYIFGARRPITTPGRVDCQYEVTGFVAPWLKQLDKLYPDLRVLHLIRHPVPWLTSVCNSFGKYKCEKIPSDELWRRACSVYERWHGWSYARVEKDTMRIEDICECREQVGWLLNRELDPKQWADAVASAERGNSRSFPVWGTWEDLPESTRQYAEKYGYSKGG